MPWKGPGKRYYYQVQRVGGRIVYTYYGTGQTATLIAEIDQLDKERRRLERMQAQRARNEFNDLAAIPDAITLLLEQAKRAAAAALVAAGYHQHKRQWRKKRADKDKNQGESNHS
jgi:hypothetical protein